MAVRPYKTRYYCNTGRLIESFPDAFCGAVHYMRAHANFKRPRRPFLSRTDYSFFLSSPLFTSIFFTRLSIALSSRFRRRATIPAAIFDATDSRHEVLYESRSRARGRGNEKICSPKTFRVKEQAIDILVYIIIRRYGQSYSCALLLAAADAHFSPV